MIRITKNFLRDRAVDNQSVCVTLVHGTVLFRRMQRFIAAFKKKELHWYEENSEFHSTLKTQLELMDPHRYFINRPFKWPGSNLVRARHDAAGKLVKHLRESSTYEHLIIAHSHGGNVVRQALDQIKGEMNVRVITLATPFVEVKGRDASLPFTQYLHLMILGLVSCLLLANQWTTHHTQLTWTSDLIEFVVSKIDPFILFVIFVLFAIVLVKVFASDSAKKINVLSALTKNGTSWVPEVHLLALRTIDDEASLVLSVGTVASRVSRMMHSFLARTSRVLFPAYLVLMIANEFLIHQINFNLYGNSHDALRNFQYALLWSYILTTSQNSIILLSSLCLMFVIVASLFKGVYGYEFMTFAVGCNINAQSVPDTANADIDVVSLPAHNATKSGLRHYIYNHPQCITEITRWVARSDRARKI